MKLLIFFFFLFFFPLLTLSQSSSQCYAILVYKNGSNIKVKNDMRTFTKRGFVIYEDIFYKFTFKDGNEIFGKIIKITRDSLYITNDFNKTTSLRNSVVYDTLEYSIFDIVTLHLNTNGFNNYYRKIDISKYNFVSIKSDDCKNKTFSIIPSKNTTIVKRHIIGNYLNIQISVPKKFDDYLNMPIDGSFFLTNDGIAVIYELNGEIIEIRGLKSSE